MEFTRGIHKVLTMNKPIALNLAEKNRCLIQKDS